jgi:hypothetical protein
MDSYTITIAPNDDSGNSTTLIVDTTGDQVQITDVHLHAAGGLAGGQMPTIDIGLLLHALTNPAGSPTPIEATATPASAITAPAPAEAEKPTAEIDAAPAATTRRSKAVAAKPRRAKRAPTAERAAQPETAPAATPAKATTTSAAVKRPRAAAGTAQKTTRKTAKTAAAAPAASSGRVYRRMPDDFAAVYQQAGTPAAVAAHYEVPRHTAQGWIRRATATNPAPSRR